jgi:RNA polymerase sigma factor (sigma-70 family)
MTFLFFIRKQTFSTINFNLFRLLSKSNLKDLYLEEILINNSINRDKSAFSQLISIYRKPLFSYIFKRCGNRETAEDLFQETLIRVWKNLKNYKESQKFSSWLFSIAHNLTIDSFRKNKNYFDDIEDKKELASSENLELKIEHDERKILLQDAIKNLTPHQKEVFLLRQHGELTFKEIAQLTNQPLNTVLSHMNYAMKKLKRILREENAA